MHDELSNARALIGAAADAIPTPALLVDIAVVKDNIAEMARRMDPLPAALRPHAKIHKSPEIARLQLDAGAIGIATATVWEAAAMVADGLDEILICNQVAGPVKAAELARIAGRATVNVLVESATNADELSAAATAAGSVIGVLVELDVGLHRAGVRGVDAAVELARHIDASPGLQLRGPFGYEGHCMLEPDRALRVRKAEEANAELIALADELDRIGLPTEIVGAGGLGTWDITGANERITEIHAGSHVFMDAFHRALVPGFEPALTVLSTVISRNGEVAVVDCGRKSVGIDRAAPQPVGIRGEVRREHGELSIHEEHILLTLEGGPELGVGDTVRMMPGYAPTTVNFFDCFFVIEGEVVADVWPVRARYGAGTVGVGG